MQGILSVIIPSYNEQAMIRQTIVAVCSTLHDAGIPHELIFVDDGSADGTWDEIVETSRMGGGVRGVRFSRNFGKEAAIRAGLEEAKGDCCAVMDCDLQHPPEKLVEMYALWQQGFEVIEGRKDDRGDESRLHAFAAGMFYKLLSKATRVDMADASDFKLLDRRAVDALLAMPERGAFFRALSSWVGFRTAEVRYEVQPRQAGTSKWSTRSLIRYAVNNLTSFSDLPLYIAPALGVCSWVVCFIWAIIALICRIAGVHLGAGTGLGLLMLLLGGGMLIALGVIGFYLGRIYDEIKARPRFIVAETCGSGVQE